MKLYNCRMCGQFTKHKVCESCLKETQEPERMYTVKQMDAYGRKCYWKGVKFMAKTSAVLGVVFAVAFVWYVSGLVDTIHSLAVSPLP